METVTYSKGKILFREGDLALTMYVIKAGTVGVYTDYGTSFEKQIAVLKQGDFLGEMGMIEGLPRTATAVVLENETVLSVISEEEFFEYFEKEPVKILVLMQQMCNRLRRTSKDYLEACRTVHDTVAAEKAGKPKSGGLLASLQKLCAAYKGYDYFAHN